MTDVSIRYWKRPEKDGIIYFATATNAGHAKAEADERATEVQYEEYSQNVPQQVHNGADRIEQAHSGTPIEYKQAAWMALQAWTHSHGDSVAIQDQIAMLELWKHQLCMWATSTMAAKLKPEGVASNVN